MSPADLDLARELRSKMPETDDDLSESWVVEGDGRRVVRGRLAGMRFVRALDETFMWVPDIHDPTGATAGVLLAMVWEADPGAMVRRDPHRSPRADPFTVALTVGGGGRTDGRTAGVALARALLATDALS